MVDRLGGVDVVGEGWLPFLDKIGTWIDGMRGKCLTHIAATKPYLDFL